MLEKLNKIIREDLHDMLRNIGIWKSMVMNRYKPVINRAYTTVGEDLLSLHRMDCFGEKGKALFHPHPWPGAFYILKGNYKLKLGVTADLVAKHPETAATIYLKDGCSYEMPSPYTWHAVTPIDECTYSIMLNGPTWPVGVRHSLIHHESDEELGFNPMDDETLFNHLSEFDQLLRGNNE